MHLGTAWYPEHWPEERWATDIQLMQEAGMTVVRIGEFAWSMMEPAPGAYDFDWLERAVDLAVEAGLDVVLCTPTPTPPAWMIEEDEDILPVRDQGSGAKQLHGQRGHVNMANRTYRDYCERLCVALGKRFKKKAGVIGWQIDNEFWSIAANESTMQAFRQWLRKKYKTLDNLNDLWSTSFWSQTYFEWSDIQAPLEYPNPGLYLDWYRFHSALTADFQALQIKALRRSIPKKTWITHNFHPYDDFDRSVISEDLDLVSWDAYIVGDELRLDPAANGLDSDRLRGIKRQNIWIMETLPGFVNWRPVNRHAAPGETKAMAWQMVGHGADAILYWQWRSAPTNQEQYHGCLIQQDGNPRPIYSEIKQLGDEFKRCAELLRQTVPVNDIALFDRWSDRQVLKKQPHHQDYDQRAVTIDWYRPWQNAGYTLDVLSSIERVDNYKVLLAPHLHLLSDEEIKVLDAYVAQGGHLILGPRSGMKDAYNRLRPELQPGAKLSKRLKGSVEEFFALGKSIALESTVLTGSAQVFAERLLATGADVLATYGPEYGAGASWLTGTPAVITRQSGKGRITYVGCCGDEAFYASLMRWVSEQSQLLPHFTLPEGVEVTCRAKGKRRVFIVINHSHQPRCFSLPGWYHDHLSEADYEFVHLEPAQSMVLTQVRRSQLKYIKPTKLKSRANIDSYLP